MSSSTAGQEVVATSKFKSSKTSTTARQRQQEREVVDDWDAESSDDGDAIDKSASTADVFRASKDQWTEA